MITSTRVEDVFLAALEKGTPEERAAYLRDACRDAPELFRRVERLLEAHPKAQGFLEHPAPPPDVTSDLPIREGPGTVIGPYKLLEQIGEGGMGVVFMAEQTRPVQRRVALKIIKAGMDTRQVVARFEAERQALAMMDHPNIARVLEVGATETGRPYFVMELVRGVPMTEFCNQKNLSIRDRLELFVTVCQAVQHAHQKGIIHRDIKPTNVLVTLHDGRPTIKVIDFGVAKATGQKLTDKTLFTGFTQMIGTPLYMSPEQAEMTSQDIDTRSDIFSAGVLLYELLTGTTPFDSDRLKSASFDELRRIIREEEPPRPSTRLTTLALEAASTVCTQRKSDPRHLSRLFRGELDWIVMKCLEKDRTRRYETASALAGDVERYLRDEPVQAYPPSARYRFGKFARRNKAGLVTVAAVMAALVLGTVVSTWQAIRAFDAEAQAKTNEQAETMQRERAEEISKLLGRAFRNPNSQRDGRTITAVEVLDRSVNELQDKFADNPLTKAGLLRTIGESYDGLGLSRKAIPLLEQARDLYVVALGREHRDTLGSMSDLALAYRNSGRIDETLKLAEEILRVRKAKLGPDDTLTLSAMSNLAVAYIESGRLAEATALDEETLKLRKAKLGPDHPDTLESMGNLANAYSAAGRIDEALRLYEETLKLCKAKLGPTDDYTLNSMSNLAKAYQAAGRIDEALRLYEETLKLSKANLGPDHPDTLDAMYNLANGYRTVGRIDEALRLGEETLKLRKAKLGSEYPDMLNSMTNLACDYLDAGRIDEALRLGEETLKLKKAKLGPDHPDTLNSMDNLAATYLRAGRLNEALSLGEETLKLKKAKLGADHPDTLNAMNNLAAAYEESGRFAEATALDEETLKLRKAKLGPDHSDTLGSMGNLANAYEAAGRIDEALRLGEDMLKLTKGKLGPNDNSTIDSMNILGRAYWYVGRLDKALPLLEEALKLQNAKLGLEHPDTLDSMNDLAEAYIAADRRAEALPMFEETLKFRKAKLGPEHPDTLRTTHTMAEVYLHANRLTEAEPMARECLAIREKKRPDEWRTFDTRSLLGGVLLAQKQYAEAEPLLISGYEGMHDRFAKVPAYDKPRVRDALHRLVQLYEATNRPDKAAEGKAKLAEFDEAAIKENPAALKEGVSPTKQTKATIEPKPVPRETSNSGK